MAKNKMHADEVDTDVALVRRLIAVQFPHWVDLPIRPVESFGTDNALYRLGDDMVARLPRHEATVATLRKERAWLPRLAPHLPLAVPLPLADGVPADGYPFDWSVYTWLPGADAIAAQTADPVQLADDLAGFIAALKNIDPSGGPAPGEHNFLRGVPLAQRDAPTRAAIATLARDVDAEVLIDVWQSALTAPVWSGPPVWIHGDLDARNLLVTEGRLSAVIDWGGFGAGDPAYDVMVAWKVLSGEARDAFRRALAVDDATWTRARGGVVSQAVIALAYYTLETNPVLVREAQRWLGEVVGGQRCSRRRTDSISQT
jgi:aminoglycoside phosphotransferase (APT) family kinase protein